MRAARRARRCATRCLAKVTRTGGTHSHRPDPIELLIASNEGRLPELVPIRHGRMLTSPFAFMRGAAAVMASDLSRTPSTRIRVQACGDCHLMNFGGFATPERRMNFSINDFDETLPAPWEWDLKRLAASFVVAGRHVGLKERDTLAAAESAVRSYRRRMAHYAEMRAFDVCTTTSTWSRSSPRCPPRHGSAWLTESRRRVRAAWSSTIFPS
jgi:uncharacterized protein (DUF2252 family)